MAARSSRPDDRALIVAIGPMRVIALPAKLPLGPKKLEDVCAAAGVAASSARYRWPGFGDLALAERASSP
jgi:hypothetical protein